MRLSELINGDTDSANLIVQGLTQKAALDTDITGITADSREVRPGFLFAALPGSELDGRKFIGEAINKGAIAVLTPQDETELGADAGKVSLIQDENPRHRLARMAAKFYAEQPETVAAITGTNGKTSTAEFLRQIWANLGRTSASLGTLGTITNAGPEGPGLTTPDPIALHDALKSLTKRGVSHLALEASSHGLEQCRLDGVNIRCAAFTNLSRDHLDYHPDMDAYFAAKVRLFREVMAPGGTSVLNFDSPKFAPLAAICGQRNHEILTFGENPGAEFRISNRLAHPAGQKLGLIIRDRWREIDLPLIGDFQALNVLCAVAMAVGCGSDFDDALAAAAKVSGVRGRLERATVLPNGAAVYVDYAHTPGALTTALQAISPHVEGRLHVIFGCGGDRDPGKRPLMGRACAEAADEVILTDDNPRSEDPALIRQEALLGCPDAIEIGDREEAIHFAVGRLEPGDLLVVAGKGHEQGQTIKDDIRPFDDVSVAQKAGEEVRSARA